MNRLKEFLDGMHPSHEVEGQQSDRSCPAIGS